MKYPHPSSAPYKPATCTACLRYISSLTSIQDDTELLFSEYYTRKLQLHLFIPPSFYFLAYEIDALSVAYVTQPQLIG
jgi:hypothetical protein